VADPTIIDSTGILVRIDTSTICGSDLHILKEMRPRRPLTRRTYRARLYLYAFLAGSEGDAGRHGRAEHARAL
jgi:threonine dehydrogenase-like Zn-dependent dehydrogenase